MPLRPPIEPMLAKLARELPVGEKWRYEPKWDGFRCLAFLHGESIELYSRNQRPLARYFPEIVESLRALRGNHVVDGELMVVSGERFDFGAIMARLHPAASRVAMLSQQTPATFVAFDLLGGNDDDLIAEPFSIRRERLEHLLSSPIERIPLNPLTSDPIEAAAWLTRFTGSGIDGVVAKDATTAYQPGRRAMVKVKLDRTADCVVAGFRFAAKEPVVSSLLLGLYERSGGDDVLRHVGVVGSFTKTVRRKLTEDLLPRAVELRGHPWEQGFALEGGAMGRLKGSAGRWTPEMEQDWVPLAPELVCEVGFDQVDGCRFRHPARWRRWRPDRDPLSCRIDQVEQEPENARKVLEP